MMRFYVTVAMVIFMMIGTVKNENVQNKVRPVATTLNSTPMVRFQKRGKFSFFSTVSKGLKAASSELPRKVAFKGPSHDLGPNSALPKNTANEPSTSQNLKPPANARKSNDEVGPASKIEKGDTHKAAFEAPHSSSESSGSEKNQKKEKDSLQSFLTSGMKDAFQTLKEQNENEGDNPNDPEDPSFGSSFKEESKVTKRDKVGIMFFPE